MDLEPGRYCNGLLVQQYSTVEQSTVQHLIQKRQKQKLIQYFGQISSTLLSDPVLTDKRSLRVRLDLNWNATPSP